MSRVRDALKRANAMPFAEPPKPVAPARTPPAPASACVTLVEEPIEDIEIEAPAREEVADEMPPVNLRTPTAPHPLLPSRWIPPRWIRRLLRLAGVRTGKPASICRGVTRVGQACRAPAMANGFCRQHGGSRSGVVAETTRSLLARISLAR